MNPTNDCHHLASERVSDGLVITPIGPLVRSPAWLDDVGLLAQAEQVGSGRLYLDLHRLEGLASQSVGWLFRLRKRVQDCGGRLVLYNLQPQRVNQYVPLRKKADKR